MELRDFVKIGKKIVCIGRNYKEHVKELSNVVPDAPVIFLKPTTSYLTSGSIKLPRGCANLHHEVELGVVIGQTCSHVDADTVMARVGGYALALDMTARDLQSQAKQRGLPWTIAKGFDTACPISRFLSKEEVGDPSQLKLWCRVNGVMQQSGATSDMIWDIPNLISYVSQYMTLEPADLVLTGTPAGVGPVVKGDTLSAGIDNIVEMEFNVA